MIRCRKIGWLAEYNSKSISSLRFPVNASGGIEFKERYGIYVTGEYAAGNDDREDYKIGVTLKASF